MIPTRDRHVDVMLFWGIIFVVMGHNYQPPWLFFPAYTFHIAFFAFISGYLFRIRHSVHEKLEFAKRKTITQLIPYFIFNSLFFLLSYLLRNFDIKLSSDISLYTFFVAPFLSGHQNAFMIPLWFLLNLYLVNLIMQALYFTDRKIYTWLLSLVILGLSLFLAYQGLLHATGLKLLIVRTGFLMLFFQLGVLIKRYKEKVDAFVLKPLMIPLLWLTVVLITNYYGNIEYSIVFGSVENPAYIVPIITTTLIIMISYSICFYISHVIHTKSLIVTIGQNTFWIMALHLFVFFIVNTLIYKMGLISKGALDQIYFQYDIERTFIFYELPAIALPVLAGILFATIKPGTYSPNIVDGK